MAFFTEEEQEILNQNVIRVATLVELQFASETMYVWAGDYPLNVGGQTWLPLKGHGLIENLNLLLDGTANSTTLSLPALPEGMPDFLAQVLISKEEVLQRPAILYLQFFDSDWQPIGNPALLTYGYMQPPKVSRTAMTKTSGSQQGISVDLLSSSTNRSRPSSGFLTDRDQKLRFNNDPSLEPTVQLANGITTTYPDY